MEISTMPFSKVYKVPRVVNLTGFGLWTYNGMLLWRDDMLFLTAFGHEGCYNQSSVNLATRYKACQLLASRLCQSAQDDDERGDGPTVLLLCGVPIPILDNVSC